MKYCLIILLFIPFFSSAQNESNAGWITYDSAIQTTVDGLHFHQYTFRITRPPNGDTSKRISIWFMPGEGENGGTDTTKLVVWGPHYWLKNGWDGSVTLLSGGKRCPILVSCISDQTAPYAEDNLIFMNTMLSQYHIFRHGAIHITGLSAGAWAWSTMINYQTGAGLYDGMKNVTSVLCLSGFATNALYPGDQNPPYQIGITAWGYWAKHYGGKYFGLQGSTDGVGGIYEPQQNMDDTISGKAYFSYNSVDGGGHGGWNTDYDPSQTHWNSVTTPLGPNNVTGAQPNAQGTYIDGENLFTWEVMQGDTTAVTGAAPPTVSAGSNQTITLPTSSVTLSGSASANSPATSITAYLWTQLSGPNTGTFSSTTTTGPTFSGLIAGTYVLNLRATDNNSNQNNAQVTITVNSSGGHACTVYYWDSTQTNIAINRTNYATLQACDSVKIRPKIGGYRSRYLQKINSGSVPNPKIPNTYVTVYWMPGAYITPSGSSEQANGVDSIYGVHEVGMKMNDHVDPENFNFAGTGYVQYYWVDKDTCIGCSGWIPQGLSLSLSAFTGGADSVHCFYMDSISNSYFDSVGTPGTFDGLTSLWIGNLPSAKNQTWVRFGVTNSFFGDNPSTHNPACFIHLMGVFGATIKNNTFRDLGGGTGTYVGHAAQIFCRACSFDVSDNHFETGFGNCVRNVGAGGLSGWPGMNYRSTFHNNIDSFPVKYPFIETQRDTVGDSIYVPSYVPRASPYIYNTTFAHPAMGVGHQYYNCSTVDAYAVAGTSDTISVYNCLQYGPTDTLATVCTGQGCNAFMTFPNGAVAEIDSAGIVWSQTLTFSGTGLSDSVLFRPAKNGILYNNGRSNSVVVSGIDPYGTAFPVVGRASFGLNTGIDIGAVMLPGGSIPIGPIPTGSKLNVVKTDSIYSHSLLVTDANYYTLDTLTMPINSTGLFDLFFFAYDTLHHYTGTGEEKIMLARIGSVYQAPYPCYLSVFSTSGLPTHQLNYNVTLVNGLPLVRVDGYGVGYPISWHVMKDQKITPL